VPAYLFDLIGWVYSDIMVLLANAGPQAPRRPRMGVLATQLKNPPAVSKADAHLLILKCAAYLRLVDQLTQSTN
jgi:hypothetical protein